MSGRIIYQPPRRKIHACQAPPTHDYPEGTIWQCDTCGDQYRWERVNPTASPWWWRVNWSAAQDVKQQGDDGEDDQNGGQHV